MKNERIPHPSISIFAFSKQQGLIPTSAYARQARCYVHLEPVNWCSLTDSKALCQIFEDIILRPVPEAALTFDEVKATSVVSDKLGGAKTLLIDFDAYPDRYHLRVLRSNSKGEWLGKPYALEQVFPPGSTIEQVVLAIVNFIKTSRDLPEEANLPSTSVA